MITSITDLQTEIGVEPDGKWGPKSAAALLDALQTKTIIVTKNITLNELVASRTATARGINNIPDGTVLANLIESANNLWQPVRDFLDKPMIINSGYRSKELNAVLPGSAKNSSHMYGYAIDFVSPGYGNTRKIVKDVQEFLIQKGIPFDQIILEYPNSPGSWVHLGYKKFNGEQRKMKFQIG